MHLISGSLEKEYVSGLRIVHSEGGGRLQWQSDCWLYALIVIVAAITGLVAAVKNTDTN